MKPSPTHEWQFDGLVGPTHNYAGLAHGNIASGRNAGAVSNPRAAALQGIQKMRFVRDLGMRQAFLPPHPRPLIPLLQSLGFGAGTSRTAIARTLESVATQAPELLTAVYSASFMWTANAATVSPSADTVDGKLHFTPANLVSHFHRSIEAPWTTRLLRSIFHDEACFTVHDPLPATTAFSDEGAANHMRISAGHTDAGIHCFVYGASAHATQRPQRYQARQQLAASALIANQHGLHPTRTLYLQQSPAAIDAGVFHNDVIAMNSDGLMIAHAMAFADDAATRQLTAAAGTAFRYISVSQADLPVDDAISSYFFNAQLLHIGEQYILIAPRECEENARAHQVIQQLLADGSLHGVHFLDVRESMRNGGGPACLRLRVRMTEIEAAAMHPGIIATDEKLRQLEAWVSTHYRDRLSFDDLRDPAFLDELNVAYTALGKITGLSDLYP